MEFGLPLIYASSAATYGDGSKGYVDSHEVVKDLEPSTYGRSKNDFDALALAQERKPYFWAGFKFFNVYGPNEFHKGRMASVVLHTFRQVEATGGMKSSGATAPTSPTATKPGFRPRGGRVQRVAHFMHHRIPALDRTIWAVAKAGFSTWSAPHSAPWAAPQRFHSSTPQRTSGTPTNTSRKPTSPN